MLKKLKMSEYMLPIAFILITFVDAKLDMSCLTAIPKLPKFECFNSSPIGAGTASVVYTIRLKGTDIIRALKISDTNALVPEKDPEIAYLSLLQSLPHIVTLYPPAVIESINGNKYLLEVLELAKYGDLDQFVEVNPTFFNDDIKLFKFCIELVTGLKEIHSMNIIHASVKAQNIIVTDNYIPKYIDFNWSVPNYSRNHSRGDHLFNAPEVVLNRNRVIDWDTSKDVYSLGVVFYYLTHQQVPFNGITRYFHKRDVQKKRYKLKEGLRADFAEIIQKMLKYDPKHRASLNTIEELLMKAQSNTNPSRLVKDQIANLDNESLEEMGLIEMDPLLIFIGCGCVVIFVVLAFIVIRWTKSPKKGVSSNRTELFTKDNNI